MKEKEKIRCSKYFSYLLRHNPYKAHLTMNQQGWVSVNQLISHIQKDYPLTKEDLDEIVRDDQKQRYKYNEDKTMIRASQGHSIQIDLQLKPKSPPNILYHGTSIKNEESIQRKGLLKQSRQYVHLSSDRETAISVGKRHAKTMKNILLLEIDCQKMVEEGYLFFQADNGVWLIESVPPQYIKKQRFL